MDFLFGPEPVLWLQETLGLRWVELARAFSLLGTSWGVLLVLSLALWFWGRDVLYALVGLAVLELGLRTLVAQLVAVPRPAAPGIVEHETLRGAAFPSGHVSTATTLWGYAAARGRASPLDPLLVALAIGGAQLYLGTHRVGDVLGGVLLAVLAAWLWSALWPRLRGVLRAGSFAVAAGAAAAVLAGVVVYGVRYLGDDPVQWRAAGLAAGVAVAVPLEWRWVRYEPVGAGRGLKLLTGLAGILAALLVDQLTGASLIAGLATFLAAVWALLLAPALFAGMGLGAADRARRALVVDDEAARVEREVAAATRAELGVEPVSANRPGVWIALGAALAMLLAGRLLGWSQEIAWWSAAVHGFTTFAVTLWLALLLYGTTLMGAKRHGPALFLAVALLGLGLGAAWELAEWAYARMLASPEAASASAGALLQLAWDAVGAVVAAIWTVAVTRSA